MLTVLRASRREGVPPSSAASLCVVHFCTGHRNAEMFFSPNSRKRSRLTKACLIHVGNSHISVIFIRLRYYYRAAEQPALITPRLTRLSLSLRQERHLANSMFNSKKQPRRTCSLSGGLREELGRPAVSIAANSEPTVCLRTPRPRAAPACQEPLLLPRICPAPREAVLTFQVM